MKEARRDVDLRGIPCMACGSTTSRAGAVFGDRTQVVCFANESGRDRCREREMKRAFGV